MGYEDNSRLDSPDSSPKESKPGHSLYSSPISQPSRPTSLNIPDPTPPEPRNLADEVGDMLKTSANRSAPATSTPAEKPAAPAAPLTHCPKCNAKLSSLDLKMGQCFKCNTTIDPDAGPDRPARGPVTIGI